MTQILIINNAEPGTTEFTAPLAKIVEEKGYLTNTIDYKDCQGTDFTKFDGVIMSGSPQGDDIIEHHAPYFEWIKNCEMPVFGICAGHHITGYLFGSEILHGEEPEAGDVEIEILKDDPLFKNVNEIFLARQMHNDSITLPVEFELLAASATCRVQLMKHKTKSIYTSQFHPEFNNPELLENFISLCC